MSDSYFVDRSELHTIYMEPFDGSSNWFKVLRERSRADKLALADAAITLQLAPDTFTVDGVRTRQMAEFEALLRNVIREWSFVGPDGRPAPINVISIRNLGERVGRYMAKAIEDYYRSIEVTEDELKNLLTAPSPGVVESDHYQENLPTSSWPGGLASTRNGYDTSLSEPLTTP